MKAYAFSMLSAAAILALAAAAPTSVHAAGFGAATVELMMLSAVMPVPRRPA